MERQAKSIWLMVNKVSLWQPITWMLFTRRPFQPKSKLSRRTSEPICEVSLWLTIFKTQVCPNLVPTKTVNDPIAKTKIKAKASPRARMA